MSEPKSFIDIDAVKEWIFQHMKHYSNPFLADRTYIDVKEFVAWMEAEQ